MVSWQCVFCYFKKKNEAYWKFWSWFQGLYQHWAACLTGTIDMKSKELSMQVVYKWFTIRSTHLVTLKNRSGKVRFAETHLKASPVLEKRFYGQTKPRTWTIMQQLIIWSITLKPYFHQAVRFSSIRHTWEQYAYDRRAFPLPTVPLSGGEM